MKKRWFTTLFLAFFALVCVAFFGCDEGNINDTGSANGSNTDLSSGSEDISDSGSPDIYGPLEEITYETTEYLADVSGCNPDYEKAGETVTIATHILTDVDLVVFVNGEMIEQIHSDVPYWLYTFTMPADPVHITFKTRGVEYLAYYEPWLSELSADDIAVIKESNEIAGLAPGNFITHYTVTDSENIATLLDCYKSTGMLCCWEDEHWQIDGGNKRTVTFTLTDGTVHALEFYAGYYAPLAFSSLTHFHVSNLPKLEDVEGRTESYSFITATENCGIYSVKDDRQWGGVGYLPSYQVGVGTFLKDLEFVEYHGAVPENEPYYCILGEYFETEYAIYVQDGSLFFMWSGNGYGDTQVTYYKLLGGVDLFTLIEQSLWGDSEGVRVDFTPEEKQVMYKYFGFVAPFIEYKEYSFRDETNNHKGYYEAYVTYSISNCTKEDLEKFKALCDVQFTLVDEYGIADEWNIEWVYVYAKDGIELSWSHYEYAGPNEYNIYCTITIDAD